MPPPDEIPTTELLALIEGTSSPFALEKLQRTTSIANIKNQLCYNRDLHGSPLQRATLHNMELWQVEIDLRLYENDMIALSTLKADSEVLNGKRLLAFQLVSQLWPRQPSSSTLSIIVKVVTGPTKDSSPLKRLLDLSELQEDQAKRHRTAEAPSGVCKNAKSMEKAQEYSEILNGRPWDASGPPVGLFHPIFDQFVNYFNDPSPKHRTASSDDSGDLPSTDDAFSFMRACSAFYEDEQTRMDTVLPDLKRLLGIELLRIRNVDQTEPDAQVLATSSVELISGVMGVFEFKLEEGISGDAKIQAQRSYARTCSLSTYGPIRFRSCCPCFLVGISGPWITVLGAVFVQKVIVQHLVGPIYLSPQLLHPKGIVDQALKLFYALRRSFKELREYYQHLPVQITTSRFFPYPGTYVDPASQVTMNIDYTTILSRQSSAVYLAKVDNMQVVVKFVATYSIRAHELLAEKALAPKIIYDGTNGPHYGGLSMIVMEYVKGDTLTQFLQSSPPPERLNAVLASVTTAIELLHAQDFVFGDLRSPNILVDEEDHVKIIDFDWTGLDGKHHYPFIVGNAIEWAKGVGPLAIMYKSHDLFMLKMLKDSPVIQ